MSRENGMELKETVSIEEIGPKKAAQYYALNHKRQRKFSTQSIARFERLMREGKWKLAPDAIAFDKMGALFNGQNRLRAIIQSGTSQRFLVARNFDPDTFPITDDGKKRTGADALYMDGKGKNAALVSAILTPLYWDVHAGVPFAEIQNVPERFRVPGKNEILELMRRHPRIRDSADYINGNAQLKVMFAPAAMAYVHFKFGQINSAARDDFFEKLSTGAGMNVGHSILVLRERLHNIRLANTKITKREFYALVIKAWNAWRLGDTIKVLRVGPSEEFPEPIES